MRTMIVLLITIGILALQFNLGLKRKALQGVILPIVFLGIFGWMSYADTTLEYIGMGTGCILAIIVVWIIGRMKSANYEKKSLDQMKAKDIE